MNSRSGVERYNVVWDSPSEDCHGSMPLGNGDIGLNAWIEPSGDLMFYIGKTDSWEDNARLAKVGKVRVRLDPAPIMAPFRQELSLADATLVARYGDGTCLRLWVDANHPVIHVSVEGERVATTATATRSSCFPRGPGIGTSSSSSARRGTLRLSAATKTGGSSN